MAKDLGLVLSAAEANKVPLLGATLMRQLMQAAQATGLGKKDWSAVFKVIRQLAGEES
jgi:3-hydroxyisobutyrate dehydrogenase-like beta-hydroxyacid dehydrogenase